MSHFNSSFQIVKLIVRPYRVSSRENEEEFNSIVLRLHLGQFYSLEKHALTSTSGGDIVGMEVKVDRRKTVQDLCKVVEEVSKLQH